MQGLMQDFPLTIPHLFRRAEMLFPTKEIVTATTSGRIRTTYGTWAARTRRLGGALDALGVSADGRVATFAWNTARHLELYFAAPGTGRILHTLNIRLPPEQISYIVNHAEDEVVFVDQSLLDTLWPLAATFESVKHIVVMRDGPDAVPDDPRIVDYETLLAGAEPIEFRVDDENRAAAMCYTSGTTGHPKGVVYSHRSTVLHTFSQLFADAVGVRESDVVLPVVPMFHANAWGLAHAAVTAGATCVMPGPDHSPPALADLIESERVTVTAGVPSIWMGVLPELRGRDTSALRLIQCGGSAVPRALSEAYREQIGLPIRHAWGMTETSPVCTAGTLRSFHGALDEDAQADLRTSVGSVVPGVEFRIADPDDARELPWDGRTTGELEMRGPWVARTYYKDPRASESFTADGWLKTGDVARVNADGYIWLVDRTKDLVKSGGEWISSVEVENEIMAHPAVTEAAVIAVPSEKWSERPLACVVPKPGESLTQDELLGFLSGRLVKWWIPDAVEFVEEIPKTSVGKFSKKALRERFADYRLP
jgi:fatty-acyl-CoA synthase